MTKRERIDGEGAITTIMEGASVLSSMRILGRSVITIHCTGDSIIHGQMEGRSTIKLENE